MMLKVLNTFFFSFQGSGPQYQPRNILVTFLKQSVELFRIQIKTQTFLYFFSYCNKYRNALVQPCSLISLNFKFGHVKNYHKGFFIYIVFNQNYIITHEHSLLFKAQHIIMHILFAKLIKETILYNPLPPLPPLKKEKLHPLPKSAANKVTVNYFHQ